MQMRYDMALLADRLGALLDEAEAALRLEQAVRGLDGLSELALHQLLAAGLLRDYEVSREVHYPSEAALSRTRRRRCDLVLTPRGEALDRGAAQLGLFNPGPVCPPERALWLEVKLACQLRPGGGAHRGYGAQFRQAVVADLQKMAAEPRIQEAALLLVVFTESEEGLRKDLALFESVLVEKGVLAGFPQRRSTAIVERIGHHLGSVVLWPTVQRGGA